MKKVDELQSRINSFNESYLNSMFETNPDKRLGAGHSELLGRQIITILVDMGLVSDNYEQVKNDKDY